LLRERWGIIDPIPGHRDDAAGALQTCTSRYLSSGRNLGLHVIDAT